MSGIINVLPDSLANQIAAGEVIQRPASVVKELLENALDAGARQIQLIIKDSGKTLIKVVDDGIGMSESDARLCFERHATSKISSTDDLFHIKSFGFRGEAMASIAAIAHVELKTKQHDADVGNMLLVEGSKIIKQEACQVADGTTVSVRNLFFNVPARRKFLKSDPVELKHILEEFTRVALPNHEVFFSVYHNDNELYHFQPSNLRQRLASYFGKNVNENIVPVSEETDFVSLNGFVGKPSLIKKSRGDQYFFVNRRFIKSNYLSHAVYQAYENLVPKDHFPFFVIMLEVDPAMIDINIHPTKQEIKFENERLIYNYLKVAVKHALGKYSITPSLDFESDPIAKDAGQPFPFQPQRPFNSETRSSSANSKEKWLAFYEQIKEDTQERTVEAITLSSDWSSDDHIEEKTKSQKSFQVHDSYIISPIKSGWIVIDQSAAHERVLYEKNLASLRSQKTISQTSLFPETIQVGSRDAAILDSLLDELKYVGFQIEKIGQTTYIVNAHPIDGATDSTGKFIAAFLESYSQNKELEVKPMENIARSMAEQMKISRGTPLSDDEMRELIDQLFACELPYLSPSGKKCFITFDLAELEQRFRS